MHVVYYSHARNTERFVLRHLMPALREHVVDIDAHTPVRVHSQGPHQPIDFITYPEATHTIHYPLTSFVFPFSTSVLFVTPTYGKFNHELGRAENYTPRPMQEIMNFYFDSRHPSDSGAQSFYAVGANRTFGKDFAKQDRIPDELKYSRMGSFELSGSQTEANAIALSIKEHM